MGLYEIDFFNQCLAKGDIIPNYMQTHEKSNIPSSAWDVAFYSQVSYQNTRSKDNEIY